MAGYADAAGTGKGHFLEDVVAAEDLAGGFRAVGGEDGSIGGVGDVVEAGDDVAG